MADPTKTGNGAGTVRPWPLQLAVVFVLLTLVALVIVPLTVQRRVTALRSQIGASEPARTLIMQWQFDLVREMAALGELLLSGDTAELSDYGAALGDEREIYGKLASLAARIGPRVEARFERARLAAEEWHERIDYAALRSGDYAGIRLSELPREQRLFEDVLLSVASVDSAIIITTMDTRTKIQRAETTGLRLTVGLGLLALLSGVAVVALQGRIRRFAAVAEKRRVEADVALAESAQAAEARARLLRGITHDVKNPLGAAKGYAELLALGVKAPLAPEQTPLVEGIQRSIDNALAIIADLLDLARVDSGGMTVSRVEADLNDIVRQAVNDHRAAAMTSGHDLKADVDDAPLAAHTDPLRVRQVLDNLLSNALKYTPAPGRIVVTTRDTPDDTAPRPGSFVAIRVSDNGPGIPPDKREAVFDEFTRLNESDAHGHGLGLAIARGLSRRLGGDLTIADSDAGATFVLWIPQRAD